MFYFLHKNVPVISFHHLLPMILIFFQIKMPFQAKPKEVNALFEYLSQQRRTSQALGYQVIH